MSLELPLFDSGEPVGGLGLCTDDVNRQSTNKGFHSHDRHKRLYQFIEIIYNIFDYSILIFSFLIQNDYLLDKLTSLLLPKLSVFVKY